MNIGIIIAMDIEYRHMLSAVGGKPDGEFEGHHIILSHCGIGKVNAAIGALELIQSHKLDCVISTGMAGGVDERLKVREIIIGRQSAYHDVYCGDECAVGQVQGMPQYFDGDPRLVNAALATNDPDNPRAWAGLICTGDQFITTAEGLSEVVRKFPRAKACDMETAAIAHVCYLHKMPFLSIRVISDTPGRTEDHQMQWLEFLTTMGNHSFRWMRNYLKSLPLEMPKY